MAKPKSVQKDNRLTRKVKQMTNTFKFHGVDIPIEYSPEDQTVQISYRQFAVDLWIPQIKFIRELVAEFGNVRVAGLKETKDFVDFYYRELGVDATLPHREQVLYHNLTGPQDQLWARVVEVNHTHFIILDGWNCGGSRTMTGRIIFPNLSTLTNYIATRWQVVPCTVKVAS